MRVIGKQMMHQRVNNQERGDANPGKSAHPRTGAGHQRDEDCKQRDVQSNEHGHADVIGERPNQRQHPPLVIGQCIQFVGEQDAKPQVENRVFQLQMLSSRCLNMEMLTGSYPSLA